MLAGLVVLLVRRGRSSGTAGRRPDTGLEFAPGQTADQLRTQAEGFAAAGDWAEAVRARLRAVVLTLEERGDLDPRPGRTAAEVAAQAADVRPELRELLWSGALTFGEIWYGHRTATSGDYRVLTDLDDAVRRRPRALAGAVSGGPSLPPPAPR